MDYKTNSYPAYGDQYAIDPYFGLVGDPVGPVELDYLALGMCLDPALYHVLGEWFKRSVYVCGRLEVSAGKIFFDGRAVGQIKGAVGAPSAFGRKIVWNFTGEWFRAGLSEVDAICLMRELEVYLAELPQLDVHFQALEVLRGKPWINFVSIDRVDYALNVSCGRALRPDDLQVIPDLPYGAGWHEGMWNSAGGRTVYASTTSQVRANRGTFDHLCVYQTPEQREEGILRLEYRCPRVRATDGSGSIEGAALRAAHYFAAILRRDVRVLGEDPERDAWEPPRPDEVVVKPLNFEGKWAPEHYFRQVYSGHPTHTMMRLLKQGVSLIHRVGGAAITSQLLDLERGRETSEDDKTLQLHVQPPIDEDQLDKAEEMLIALRRHFYKDSKPVALRLGAAKRIEDQNGSLEEFAAWSDRFRVPKVVRVWSVLDPQVPLSPSAATDFYRHDHWMAAHRSWEAGERSRPPRWGLMG